MKREHFSANSESGDFPNPIFYAPLTSNLLPTIAYNDDLTIAQNTNFAYNSTEQAVYNTTTTSRLRYNVPTLANTDYTFSIWIKRIANAGCSYSFGAAHPNNSRYYGLYYEEHSSNKAYKLGTEFANWFFNTTHTTQLTMTNAYSFITWQIKYNGSNSYTCAIYLNGNLIHENTFTNSSWLGLNGCYVGISNGTSGNAMRAYYKHYSVYDQYLTADQILLLYNNGGIPL